MEDAQAKEVPANSRRDFFRGIFKKVGATAVREAENRAQKAALRFVRPPGNRTEIEFLTACTRCGDCVGACPHGTIFLLGPHTLAASGTPSLDLIHHACHLCEDFPCIAACEPGALTLVAVESLRFASIRIDESTCLPYQGPECGVCVAVCPIPGALTLDGTRPVIDTDRCNGCALCRESCIVTPSAITVHPLEPDTDSP